MKIVKVKNDYWRFQTKDINFFSLVMVNVNNVLVLRKIPRSGY